MIRTRTELEEKIKDILGIDTISLLISKQITKYVTEHKWTYLEIGRALYYFFDVKEGDPTKSQGIGIVPYVMEDARKYFKEMEKRAAQQAKEAQESREKQQNIIVCNTLAKSRRKKRIVDIESIKEEDNSE